MIWDTILDLLRFLLFLITLGYAIAYVLTHV